MYTVYHGVPQSPDGQENSMTSRLHTVFVDRSTQRDRDAK